MVMSTFTTDASRWRALTIRDATADGQFVYSVKSTNIYCRPTCPARLCRRANVGFYNTSAEAEAAGFRACKRCKPQEKVRDDPQERAVARACTLIEEAVKADNPKSFRLQDLAKSVGLTPRYFHKIFKDRTGLTPKEYAKAEMAEYKQYEHTEAVYMNANARGRKDAESIPTESSASVTPVAEDINTTQETSFNLEDFDFNDLVDFDPVQTLPLDNTLPIGAPDQYIFGHEIDVNIQPPPWIDPYDPNIQLSGSDSTNGKLDPQLYLDPIPPTLGWQSYPSMMGMSTFELDATLILSGVTSDMWTEVDTDWVHGTPVQ